MNLQKTITGTKEELKQITYELQEIYDDENTDSDKKEELKQIIDELQEIYNDKMKDWQFKAVILKMNTGGVEIGIKLTKKE